MRAGVEEYDDVLSEENNKQEQEKILTRFHLFSWSHAGDENERQR
jgi:hypothetical protein